MKLFKQCVSFFNFNLEVSSLSILDQKECRHADGIFRLLLYFSVRNGRGPNSSLVGSHVCNSTHRLFTTSRGFPGCRGCRGCCHSPHRLFVRRLMLIPDLTPGPSRPLTPEASDYHFSDTSDRRGIQGSSVTN